MFGLQKRTPEKRVAFILGNSKYQEAPLDNSVRDAEWFESSLIKLDFKTIIGRDLTHNEFWSSLTRFETLVKDADVAVFFYSGHGIQVKDENFLVLNDDQSDLNKNCVRLSIIINLISKNAKKSFIFLDACRNNPLAPDQASSIMGDEWIEDETPQIVKAGLAEEKNIGPGSIIAYATAPGSVATEGEGKLSPFTEGLINHISTNGLEVREMLRRVRIHVLEKTNFEQTPWTNSTLSNHFYFKPISLTLVWEMLAFACLTALLLYLNSRIYNANNNAINFGIEGIYNFLEQEQVTEHLPFIRKPKHLGFFLNLFLSGIILGGMVAYLIRIYRNGNTIQMILAFIFSVVTFTVSSSFMFAYLFLSADTYNLINDYYDENYLDAISLDIFKSTFAIFSAISAGAIASLLVLSPFIAVLPELRKFWNMALIGFAGAAAFLIALLLIKLGCFDNPNDDFKKTDQIFVTTSSIWLVFLSSAVAFNIAKYVPDAKGNTYDKNLF